jgi:hypothetical protein
MDGRFLALGVGLVAASGGVYWAGWSHSSWVWGIPFAVILLFLGLVGQSPGAEASHYFASMNVEGRPSERKREAAGHEPSK